MILDVLFLIAQHLRKDTASLLQLCIIDKTTYRLLRFTLYQHVQLVSESSIKSFCWTVTSSSEPLVGQHVLSLSIGSPDRIYIVNSFRMSRTSALNLYSALQLMPNLEDLTLSLTSKALKLTLNNINPPFKLKRFIYSGDTSNAVLQFLKNQSSISELGIWSYRIRATLFELFEEAECLPCLKRFWGNLDTLFFLGLSRPIELLVVVNNMDLDTMPIGSTPEPIASVISIHFIASTAYYFSWVSTLRSIIYPRLLATLRYLQAGEGVLVCLSSRLMVYDLISSF